VGDGSAVDPIPITDQVARGLSPRECLSDLTCDPFRGRMWCDVDPDDNADGERAATEAEAKDLVRLGLIVAADELVEVDDIALQAPAKCAAAISESRL
jgi:hypothetical protein